MAPSHLKQRSGINVYQDIVQVTVIQPTEHLRRNVWTTWSATAKAPPERLCRSLCSAH